jgi:hypothetical protein
MAENIDPSPEGSVRRAKRVIARPVNGDSAVSPPPPAEVSPAPLAVEGAAVVDPTLYSERRRKHEHVRGYRLAWLCSGCSALGSLASVPLAIFRMSHNDSFMGEVLAAGGILLAALGLLAARRTQLATRVRVYAIAALCLAVLAMGLNLIGAGCEPEAPPHVRVPGM